MLKVTLSYCYFIVPDFKKSTCLDGVFIFQEQKLWFYTNSANTELTGWMNNRHANVPLVKQACFND